MKILFLSGGAREAALEYLLEKGENVVAVITPHLTNANSRFYSVITTAIKHGILVVPVTKENIGFKLAEIDYDLFVSCGFPYIIDDEMLKTKLAINVHPTLLPRYRGFRSGPFQIINGEKESGVTIHKLTKEMDKGDILAQQSFPITIFDTTKSVFRKAREIEPRLLFDVIQKIKTGEVTYTPQDESKSTEYNMLRRPKDSEIDWEKPLKSLYNEIRACDSIDYPAFFYVEGQKIYVKLWRGDKKEDDYDLI